MGRGREQDRRERIRGARPASFPGLGNAPSGRQADSSTQKSEDVPCRLSVSLSSVASGSHPPASAQLHPRGRRY